MKLKILVTIVAILTFSIGNSQNPVWTKISKERINEADKLERVSIPSEYKIFQLDLENLKTQLKAAPSRNFNNNTVSNVIIEFPNAEGELEKYRIYESSVMEAELAEKHPEIQSYVGQGIDTPTARIYLTTTIFGLHTMTLSGKGTFYTDPYTKDLQNYIVYNKSSLTNPRNFECHVEGGSENTTFSDNFETPSPVPFANDGVFRTYRLAMACTIEYAAYHINAAGVNSGTTDQKKAAVLAAMNVTVARVNSVYEVDMSLRMVLVANNSSIIFITFDSFDNSNEDGILLTQSNTVINNNIGSSNYDIGHTVSTGGGGIAAYASVCTSNKARGVTGSFNPVGDPYNIDYVAHEMGHQFGASHTFNANTGSCGFNNRSGDHAVEPGSGTTIMAYAGICEQNDVQNNSDAYFHTVSIDEMMEHITGDGNCVVGVPNGNTPPLIIPLTSYTIPVGTPFVLRGNATDSETALTYCWEQTNTGTSTSQPSPSSTTSNPNFRSRTPSVSPNRYMPSLQNILDNKLSVVTNPLTWEVIPNVARTMSFALTVRDNQIVNGGQTTRRNMSVTFNSSAGPFRVTSQNTQGITWTNTPQTITWNVANTTSAPINTANVNILLSTDGGLTYPITLAANTPNDGTEVITVPNIVSSTCRIMIQAVNNIYIAVNLRQFAVDNNLSTENFGLKDFKLYPNPNTGNFSVEFDSATSTDIKISIYDIRGRQIFDRSYQNTGVFSQNLQLNNVQAGVYIVNINDGDRKETRKIIIN